MSTRKTTTQRLERTLTHSDRPLDGSSHGTSGLARCAGALAILVAGAATAMQTTTAPDIDPTPAPSPTLGFAAPEIDARTIVLFDGTSWDAWRQRDGSPSPWVVQNDGSVLVKGGDAVTARPFRDFQLHLEFMCPEMPERAGQARANSGVYLHGRYEVQVLDTHGMPPFDSGCAAIYSVASPEVNASRPAGEWQTYDIVLLAPRLDDDGTMREPGRVTVIHNGIVVHNNVALPHTTPGGLDEVVVPEGPILLQDHGDPVRYRNIWVRELVPPGA